MDNYPKKTNQVKASASRGITDAAHAFIVPRLSQCAQELVDWDNTGILTDGSVRRATTFIPPHIDYGERLRVVRGIVIHLCLTKVAKMDE